MPSRTPSKLIPGETSSETGSDYYKKLITMITTKQVNVIKDQSEDFLNENLSLEENLIEK